MVLEPAEHHDLERDLASADTTSWPKRAFPEATGRSEGTVPIVVRRSVLNAIYQHGKELPQVEICGVLVGSGYRDERGPFVYLEGSIRGDHAGSHTAQVTFTGETWSHIYQVLDTAWPHSRIVGWYHTHPGFGIFLSDMDLFIQENFFGAPEQVAFVYDPIRGEEGLFAWQAGKALPAAFLVEEDVPKEDSVVPQPGNCSRAECPEVPVRLPVAEDLILEVDRLRRRQTVLEIAVGLLAVIVVLVGLGTWWVMTPEPKRAKEPLRDAPPTAGDTAPGSIIRDGSDPSGAKSGPRRWTTDGGEPGGGQAVGDRQEPVGTAGTDDQGGTHATEHTPQ